MSITSKIIKSVHQQISSVMPWLDSINVKPTFEPTSPTLQERTVKSLKMTLCTGTLDLPRCSDLQNNFRPLHSSKHQTLYHYRLNLHRTAIHSATPSFGKLQYNYLKTDLTVIGPSAECVRMGEAAV